MSALDLLCGLLLEDGRRWGEAAESWQLDDARAVLDTADGAPRLHFLTRPRGGSKTTDVAGMGIAALIEQAPPRARGYALAVDADQAGLLIDAAAGFVYRSQLSGLIDVQTRRIVNLRTYASIDVLAADAASAFGVKPWWLSIDELAQWGSTANPRRLWEAAISSVPKVPGCRLIVMTSAGDPAHWTYRVLEGAKGSARWRVNEVPGPVPWLDPEDLEEQRRLLTESQYARLHLNVWTAPEDRLTSIDDLRACVTLDGPLPAVVGNAYVVAVDLGLKHDRTVAAVCHADDLVRGDDPAAALSGARVVLDRMQVWAGSRAAPVQIGDVEEWIVHACATFGCGVVLDPWQAIGLAQRLRDRGIVVEEFTFSQQSVGRLASTLHLQIRNHALALPDDAELIDELANVRLRETSPGVLRMDHDPDRHDDRAVTLALAAHWLLDRPLREVEEVVYFDPLTGGFGAEPPPSIEISRY